jgi:hypothetical protein
MSPARSRAATSDAGKTEKPATARASRSAAAGSTTTRKRTSTRRAPAKPAEKDPVAEVADKDTSATQPAAAAAAKPSRARSGAPKAPTRTRRSAGVTLDSDQQRFAETAASSQPEAAPAAPEPATEPAPEPASDRRRAAPSRPAPARKPWEREANEKMMQINLRLPESLRDRLDGVIDYLSLRDPSEIPDWLQIVAAGGSRGAITALGALSFHQTITRIEDEVNEGRPLPVLVRRGR